MFSCKYYGTFIDHLFWRASANGCFYQMLFRDDQSKGENTLWNISLDFHETQFNGYFITFNLVSWISCKLCRKESFTNSKMNSKKSSVFNLLLIEYIFSKNITKQKTKRKSSVKIKPWLKNRLYTSAFNNMLVELIVNDT